MARRIAQLEVHLLGSRAGLLSKAPHAGWNFSYAPEARGEVALTMPRLTPTYASSAILPPFDQQIPEMDLGIFSPALWKQIQPDEMGLILIAGNRRLGRLRYAEPGAQPLENAGLKIDTTEFTHVENGDEFLMDMLARIAFVPGISGMQPKTLLSLAGLDKVRADLDSHILKGNHRDYPWASLIEHLSLSAAAAAGMQVPEHTISADGRLLAVRRFDIDANGALGFDEACALLGQLSAEKYEGSYERMCRHLLRFVPPEAQLETSVALLRQLSFCYAIENGDAHLKNFGLLYDDPAQARLSPAYDLLTTTCFPSLRRDAPALTLNGRKRWDAFAELARLFTRHLLLPPKMIRSNFEQVLSAVQLGMPRFDEMQQRFPDAAEVLLAAQQSWQRGAGRMQQHLLGR
jgi:serine/threonine-protein kinase HipA